MKLLFNNSIESHNSHKSPKLLFSFFLIILFICTFGNSSIAQCPNNNIQYGSSNASSWVLGVNNTLTTCQYGGEYRLITGLTSGSIYTFQTCGDTDFDTQITIYTASGAYVAYNDDGCGLQSSAIFMSDGSDVHVLIDKYNCTDQSTCMTLIGTLVCESSDADLSSCNTSGTYCSPYSSISSFPYIEDFENTPGSEWCFNSDNDLGRIRLYNTGSTQIALMDVSTDNVTYVENSMTLALDFSGVASGSTISLDFMYNDYGDESHTQDRVQYSTDGGGTWHTITTNNLTAGSQTLVAHPTIELSAEANFAYTSTFLLKFSQYDNYGINSDGIGIDDVSISLVPDITVSTSSLLPFIGCSGSTFNYQTFTVSGINMQQGITVLAPTGFEVSTSANSGYASSVPIGSAGTIAATTVYARVTSSATGMPSGLIQCGSLNAVTENISVSGTVHDTPSNASVTSGSVCSYGESTTLTASGAPSGGTYNWYTSGGTWINQGASYTTPSLTTSTDYKVQATSSVVNLATTSAGGNGCGGGNMFDITTNTGDITIASFDVIPNTTGVQDVNIYYKSGTYVGSETSSGSWTLLGTYSITGTNGVLMNVPVAPLTIPGSSTYGIYVNYSAQYTTGANSYSDANITIDAGVGLCGGFSGVNNPRTFNGGVHYFLCSSAWDGATGSVTAYAEPTAPTSISGTTSICAGESTTLTASGGTIGWNFNTYQWGTGSVGSNIIGGATSSSYSPSPSSTTTYWVRRVGTGACDEITTAGATVTVTVSDPPTAPTSISGTTTVCDGSSTTLTASGGTEGSGTTYQWGTGSVGSNIIGGATSSSYSPTPSSTTTYWVRRVGTGSCSSTTTGGVTQVVTVNNPPAPSWAWGSPSIVPAVQGPTVAFWDIKNTDDMTASYDSSDPESDPIFYSISWREGGDENAVVGATSFATQIFTFNADEGATVRDYSVPSNNATVIAPVDWTPSGIYGGARDFTGGYMTSGSDALSGVFTFSAWIYAHDVGGPGNPKTIFSQSSQDRFIFIEDGRFKMQLYNGSSWTTGTHPTTISPNTWYHVAVVRSSTNAMGNVKLYVNGVEDHETTRNFTYTGTGTNYIGSEGGIGDRLFDGLIDEVMVLDRAVSAEQISAWYNGGTPSNATIVSEETTCGENWNYRIILADDKGCENISIIRAKANNIVGSTVETANVDDETTCGIDDYAIAIDDLNDSGTWSVSPVDAALINFPSAPSTSITASPVAGGFNQDLTLTWTPADGNCAADNVVIKFNQPVETINQDTDTWIWGGQTNTSWTTGTNWYKWDGSKWAVQSSSSPDANSKVHILSNASAGICVSGSNTGVVSAGMSSLNVGGGASLDLGSQNINITDDIVNNGNIIAGTGTVNLVGTETQTISGLSSATTEFNALVVNNSNDITMDIPFTVSSALTMTAGNINNGSNVLTLGNNDYAALLHTSGIITGKLRRFFKNAYATYFNPETGSSYQAVTHIFFPVGTQNDLRDVTVRLSSLPGTGQYLTVSYIDGAPTLYGGDSYEGLPLITDDNQVITNYDNQGYWDITPIGYNENINLIPYSMDIHMNNIPDATDYTKARIIKSAGSSTASQHHVSWSGLTNQSVTGSNSDFTITGSSTGFSFFAGGSTNGDPLPVELLSFNGSCTDGVVDLGWQTASEYNSSHFELEHSRDGATWSVVNTQAAAGNSTELLTYNYTDVNALVGDNYYMLKQIDLDGTEKTYEIINASCTDLNSDYFSVYPNPSSGSFQVMLQNSDIEGSAVMRIVDTKGILVYEKSIDVNPGTNMYPIKTTWEPGVYFISISNGIKSTSILKHSIH